MNKSIYKVFLKWSRNGLPHPPSPSPTRFKELPRGKNKSKNNCWGDFYGCYQKVIEMVPKHSQ